MPNQVIIDAEVCKGCGLCVANCPKNVLELDADALNSRGYHPSRTARIGDCIACAICGMMCPDSAITVKKEEA